MGKLPNRRWSIFRYATTNLFAPIYVYVYEAQTHSHMYAKTFTLLLPNVYICPTSCVLICGRIELMCTQHTHTLIQVWTTEPEIEWSETKLGKDSSLYLIRHTRINTHTNKTLAHHQITTFTLSMYTHKQYWWSMVMVVEWAVMERICVQFMTLDSHQ